MTILNGRCSIGATGAVSSVIGSDFSAITKETGVGNYSVTIAEQVKAFLFGDVMFACNADSAAVSCLSGTSQIDVLTSVDKATTTAGDFCVFTDTLGAKWGISVNKAGTDPEPSSAIWTAIAAGNKVHVDISAAVSSTDVSLALRDAMAALTGIGAVITVGANSTDHFAVTHVYRAPVALPVVYKEDGTASPTSFVPSQTALGVQTAIDITNTTGETLEFATAHGYETGRLVALSISAGALPTGWAAGAYYIIAVSTTKIALASTLANAVAGTRVTISDYGDQAKTITVTPTAPFGSSVCRSEFTSTSLKLDGQSVSKLYFTCYDYTGTQIDPAKGSKMYIQLTVNTNDETEVE